MKPLNKIGKAYWTFLNRLNSNYLLRPIAYLFDLETYTHPGIQRILMLFVFVVLMSLILSPKSRIPNVHYEVGEVATKNIKANMDYTIEDKDATAEKTRVIINKLPPVYDLDGTALVALIRRVESAFEYIRGEAKDFNKDKRKEVFVENRGAFFDILGVELPDDVFLRLIENDFSKKTKETTIRLIKELSGLYLVDSYDTILADVEKNGILLIKGPIKREPGSPLTSIDNIVDLNDAKGIIRSSIDTLPEDIPEVIVQLSVDIATLIIKANVTFNFAETERRKEETIKETKPIVFLVKKGEMIVSDGEVINSNHITILNAIVESRKGYNLLVAYFGFFSLVFVLIYISYSFASREIDRFKSRNKDLLLMGITILLFAALTKFFVFIAGTMAAETGFVQESVYKYVLPIVAGAMLVRIVINSEMAIFYSIISSIFSGIILGGDIFFTIYVLIGSLYGAQLVAHTKQRSTIIYAGLKVGVINAFFILIIYLTKHNLQLTIIPGDIDFTSMNVYIDIASGLFGGIFSSVLVLGLTPLVELLFGYTTDIKMIELSNLEHPLLKELVIRAPGTYHHSIIVGSLAETAATAIDANPLLARVSAYYHDVGKVRKPNYFIENIQDGINPHDKLTPQMSALILMSHVKDGVEMARKYKLGKEITDITREHHGTHLINYFYQKAKDIGDSKGNSVMEKDFRYPGPKPQTREAGIVLLADNVEAASKVLSDPRPARVEGMVRSIINRLFLDGQLDQCELTLKDLDAINISFTQVLNGIFHQRVDYPLPVITEGEDGEAKEKGPDDSTSENRGRTRRGRNINLKGKNPDIT